MRSSCCPPLKNVVVFSNIISRSLLDIPVTVLSYEKEFFQRTLFFQMIRVLCPPAWTPPVLTYKSSTIWLPSRWRHGKGMYCFSFSNSVTYSGHRFLVFTLKICPHPSQRKSIKSPVWVPHSSRNHQTQA